MRFININLFTLGFGQKVTLSFRKRQEKRTRKVISRKRKFEIERIRNA